jgi:hypothetical protein
MPEHITPDYLKLIHIIVATGYLIFLLSMGLMFLIKKCRIKFKSAKFSSSFFIIALAIYSIFRATYFIVSILDNSNSFHVSLFFYDVGSNTYYIAFLVFMIYW